MLKKNILTLLFLCTTISAFAKPQDETLVCIHGFLSSSKNMYFLSKNFKKHGWEVFSWNYSSRDKMIQEHGNDLVKELQKISKRSPNKKISFVAHSLGSLILRSALNHPDCPSQAKIGKVVLIAPPNRGSIWGRHLNHYKFFRKIAKKKAGQELITKVDFNYLGQFPETTNVLVISGSLGFNPWIDGDNDGTVAVKETCLDTPHKHAVIKRDHSLIVFSKKTFSIALGFLRE
ncbi:MAG: alpha/beta hydrolase [Parachlamydiales bacterium]|nr:alpha/beta hydrolase [Parachlamydiales bacterium]